MQSIAITQKVDDSFYCPFCGHETLAEKDNFDSKKAECPHLLYVAVTEGGLEFESSSVKDLIKNYKESEDEDDLISMDIEDGIHFSLCAPAPSSFGVFVGYKK